MALLIYFNIKKRYQVRQVEWYSKKLVFYWFIIFGCASCFMLIGFIYDIAKIVKGKIASIIYLIIFFVVCFAYIILTFFDYILIEKSVCLILREIPSLSDSGQEEQREHLRQRSEAAEIRNNQHID